MRLAWTFVAGLFFAGFVLLTTSPMFAIGVGVGWWAKRAEMFNALEGESVFGLRRTDGQLQGRMVNVNFHTALVPVAGDPRPRRLLLRLDVINVDVFSTSRAEGLIRLDAWPLEAPEDVKQPPLYTILAAGRAASIEDDSTLIVDRIGKRSVYSLSDGSWLYDTDTTAAHFTLDGDRKRIVALSAMEDDMPANTVAVLTYATNQSIIKRVLVAAQDSTRARLLRSSIPLIRPVVRLENASQRIIDLPLTAGILRIPIAEDGLDLSRAQIPAGLVLLPLTPWSIKP